MGWRLAPGTGYCDVDGELIFLDLARDRYLALRGADRAAFERLRDGEPNDSDNMTRLVQTGLFARVEGPTDLRAAATFVPASDLAAGDAPFSPRMAFAAATALSWARRAMRPHRIAATIEASARAKSLVALPGSEAALTALAMRYAACRWVVPVEPRCLIDALALDHILLRLGFVSTLVFGVRLAPFAAHCWLQTGDMILTGTAAEARNFNPVLVVG